MVIALLNFIELKVSHWLYRFTNLFLFIKCTYKISDLLPFKLEIWKLQSQKSSEISGHMILAFYNLPKVEVTSKMVLLGVDIELYWL